jgi:hypothetical protein
MNDLTLCAIAECNSPARRESFCWRHWAYWDATGDPLSTRRRLDGVGPLAGLMRYVTEDPATRCWLWIGSHTQDGYGIVARKVDGRRTSELAHRAVYRAFVGEVDAESLDHLCRVRACVNPAHLEPVSMRVNTRRGDTLAAYYASRTHCEGGHEFTPANTIQRPEGCRRCRTCKNAQGRARYASKK